MDKMDLILDTIIPVSVDKILNQTDYKVSFMEQNLEIENKDDLRLRYDKAMREYLKNLIDEQKQQLLELKVKEELLYYTVTKFGNYISPNEESKLKNELEVIEKKVYEFTEEFIELNKFYSKIIGIF